MNAPPFTTFSRNYLGLGGFLQWSEAACRSGSSIRLNESFTPLDVSGFARITHPRFGGCTYFASPLLRD